MEFEVYADVSGVCKVLIDGWHDRRDILSIVQNPNLFASWSRLARLRNKIGDYQLTVTVPDNIESIALQPQAHVYTLSLFRRVANFTTGTVVHSSAKGSVCTK